MIWLFSKVGFLSEVISMGTSITANYTSSYSLNTATPNILKLTINSVNSNDFTKMYFCIDGNGGVNYYIAQISASSSNGIYILILL